ncbi:MAG: DUF3592 domain-containing protein [Candidatus Thorarchaeota archaeon]
MDTLTPLFLIIFGLLAPITSIRFYFFYKEGKDSYHWPHVEGEVISSEIKKQTRITGTSDSLFKLFDRKIEFYPSIKYTYTVGEIVHQSERISLGAQLRYPAIYMALFSSLTSTNKLFEWAQEMVNRYPLGAKVQVFYDPNSPNKGILEPGERTSGVIFTGILSVLLWFALLITLFLASN